MVKMVGQMENACDETFNNFSFLPCFFVGSGLRNLLFFIIIMIKMMIARRDHGMRVSMPLPLPDQTNKVTSFLGTEHLN